MAAIRVTIKLENGHALLVPRPVFLTVGDTVQYETDPPGLPFRVVFELPFGAGPVQITSRAPQPVTARGMFFAKCFITPPGGAEVGWSVNEPPPESGGEHDVRP